MNPLQPLMTLLGQCERERDELALACQQADMAHRRAAEQASQLVIYRSEYEQRWSLQFKTDGRMELVNCYRGFMERLTQAVEQQQAVVTHAQAQLEQTRLALRDGEIRVASVRKLIERRVAEARLSADRRDQKTTDEFAQRAAWNRQHAQGHADAF